MLDRRLLGAVALVAAICISTAQTRAWDDAKYGRPSRSPLIEMTIPTMYDPSLAPEGCHIMGIFLQYAPYTLKESDWDAEREPFPSCAVRQPCS